MESYDAELTFFEARKFVCLMCAHVAHQAHGRFSKKQFENLRFFRIFVEFQNFSKNFPKLFFVQNRQNIVSFRSYARLNKIEAKYVILEHFEIFQIFEKKSYF